VICDVRPPAFGWRDRLEAGCRERAYRDVLAACPANRTSLLEHIERRHR
jgi:hypothetical protein